MAEKLTIEQVRLMLCQKHGGIELASDSQIWTIWHGLSHADRQRYLADLKPKPRTLKEKNHAPGDRPQTDL